MPVDLSASIYTQYKQARKRADEAMQQSAYPLAAHAYRQSAELMRQYAESAFNAKIRQQRLEQAAALDKLADQAEALPAKVSPTLRKSPPERSSPQASGGEDDYYSQVMALVQKTNIRWEDIGGLEDTKRAIKSAYGLALARKPGHVQISSWRNILLFGPPGTGKTLLAAATAGSMEATFFNVKVSNVLSKYFGESTKLVSALFEAARANSPAVIFIDEFESLTPPRGSGESGTERRLVSTLLAELDGLAGKGDDSFVLTIGATNVPWLLDNAILSRFQKRIYIPLPDEPARAAILEINITRKGLQTAVPLARLAMETEGYSGRELEQLIQTVVNLMIQRQNPDLVHLVDQGRVAVQNYQLQITTLTEDDFRIAFEQVRPSTDAKLLAQYDAWLQSVDS
jgi:SpoVK/Ycf46/Vps4 family AAA+-type ATPase